MGHSSSAVERPPVVEKDAFRSRSLPAVEILVVGMFAADLVAVVRVAEEAEYNQEECIVVKLVDEVLGYRLVYSGRRTFEWAVVIRLGLGIG